MCPFIQLHCWMWIETSNIRITYNFSISFIQLHCWMWIETMMNDYNKPSKKTFIQLHCWMWIETLIQKYLYWWGWFLSSNFIVGCGLKRTSTASQRGKQYFHPTSLLDVD